MKKLKMACVQTNSGSDVEANIVEVSAMIREAKSIGANFITTPEVVGMLEPDKEQAFRKAQTENDHRVLIELSNLAKTLSVWLLIGSISVKLSATKLSNRSFLIDPGGAVVARYSKIHMFDVQLGDGSQYRESSTYSPGTEAVLSSTPWGPMGLTICYDIRFPELYRELAQAGAKVIFIPSAFTQVTGKAHWHVLQRARAIETGCFIVSPAQVGLHAQNRQTFGHSVIVDPWGNIIADGGTKKGVIVAEIDLDLVEEARKKIPSIYHDQEYSKLSKEGLK